MIRLFSPVVFLIHLVNQPLEHRRDRARPETTLEEITALAGLGQLSNLIGAHQDSCRADVGMCLAPILTAQLTCPPAPV